HALDQGVGVQDPAELVEVRRRLDGPAWWCLGEERSQVGRASGASLPRIAGSIGRGGLAAMQEEGEGGNEERRPQEDGRAREVMPSPPDVDARIGKQRQE